MKTALRVLNDLVAEKVIKDYAIGGAMGAMFYMEAVTTMDLDVFVVFNDDLNLLPLQPIYDALGEGAMAAMRPLTDEQYAKVNFRRRQAALPYPEKVRQLVELQKRLVPIYAARGKTIVPWTDV